jgi:hypothetical protein
MSIHHINFVFLSVSYHLQYYYDLTDKKLKKKKLFTNNLICSTNDYGITKVF